MHVALSTMWAQQERFRGHMDDFARIAASAGYTAIEPSHSTDAAGLETLVTCGVLPLASLHAPTPRQRDGRGRWNGDLDLASLDEEERLAAVEATRKTIEYASRARARAVVVHLGACGRGLIDAERRLRSLFQAGTRNGHELGALRAQAEEHRAELATTHLPQARRSLAELAEYASHAGIAIGLENRLHYHEIPRYDEVPGLIAPYPTALLGYWHDVGHAEVQHRLGLVDRNLWLNVNGERTIGSHLHDVAGIVDHRAPGTGDVQWDYIRDGLPAAALRTIEVNQHTPETLLADCLLLLVERDVVPAEAESNAGAL